MILKHRAHLYFIIFFQRFVNSLVYYGVSLNAGSLSGDIFVNNLLGNLLACSALSFINVSSKVTKHVGFVRRCNGNRKLHYMHINDGICREAHSSLNNVVTSGSDLTVVCNSE